MAWLAVDEDGSGVIFEECPDRGGDGENLGEWYSGNSHFQHIIIGAHIIEVLAGRELTWADEPVEIK